MNLLDYLNTAQHSLFRFEALQTYDVGDESDMTEWWNFIEEKTQNGITMQRVRLIIFPLTDYTKGEIEIHKQSNTKGDDIRYILEEDMRNLDNLNDFWLIDDTTVLSMKYSSSGEYVGLDVIEKDTDEFITFKNMTWSRSKPIGSL